MPQQSARELAFAGLTRWRTSRQFADAILQNVIEQSGSVARDRAFVTELFYGVLRNLSLLDFWIGMLRSGSIDADSRDLLRLGIYQIFFLDIPDHAAVFETVSLAPPRGRTFINAVLRNALRRKAELVAAVKEQSIELRLSHPKFLVERWAKNFGHDEAAALCKWNNQPPPIYARVNLLKISAGEFCTRYAGCEPLPAYPDFVRVTIVPRDALAQGHCYIQDPITIAACQLLAPQPGENILDACAAPGGKTALLAQMMKNRGRIVACDRDATRVTTLRENLVRLGVENASVFQHDWMSVGSMLPIDGRTAFDRILVDTPCSNTGVMRRRVDVRWRLTPEDFQRMQTAQLAILRCVIPFLKMGGALVYSTCSIEPEENESVVGAITHEFPFLQIRELKAVLPFRDHFDGAFAAKLISTRGAW